MGNETVVEEKKTPIDPKKIAIVKESLKEIGVIFTEEVYKSIAETIDGKIIPSFNSIGQ